MSCQRDPFIRRKQEVRDDCDGTSPGKEGQGEALGRMGSLAGSGSGAGDAGSPGREFEPHVGCGDDLKKNKVF